MFIFVQLILKKLSGYCLLFAAAALLTGCFAEVDLTEEEQQLNDRLSQPGSSPPDHEQPLAITLAAARAAEGDPERPQQLLFAVTLNRPATQDLTIYYQLENGLALAGRDFVVPQRPELLIEQGRNQGWIAVDLIADERPDISKNLTLRLTHTEPDMVMIINDAADGIIADDDDRRRPLTHSGSQGSIDQQGEYSAKCEGPYSHLLDCHTAPDNAADSSRFQKLDNDGKVLAADVDHWACVRDNHSGLIWEAKQDIPFDQYHSIHSEFTVLNSRYFDWDESYHPLILSGNDFILSGIPDTPTSEHDWQPGDSDEIYTVYIGSQNCANHHFVCTSEQYALDVNQRGLCGFNDWQVPQIEQLTSLQSVAYLDAPPPQFFPFNGTFISHSVVFDWPQQVPEERAVAIVSQAVAALNIRHHPQQRGRVLTAALYGDQPPSDRSPVSAAGYQLMLVRTINE